MALATTSTPGSVTLAGDLTGTANTPQLRVTGVSPGSYTSANIVVDAKGRVVYAINGSFLGPDATTSSKGYAQVGTNMNVAAGVLSVPAGTGSVLGVANSGNTSNISISSGSVNVGSNVVQLNQNNVVTKAQRLPANTSGVSTYTPDVEAYSVHVVDAGSSLPTILDPVNGVTGDTFYVVTNTTNSGSHTLTAGYQSVNVGGGKTGSSATGLSNISPTYGYQDINVGGAKTGSSPTGLTNTSQTAAFLRFSSTNTGYPNTGTLYTVSIVINGVTRSANIAGSSMQTTSAMATAIMASSLNAYLGSATASTDGLGGFYVNMYPIISGTNYSDSVTGGGAGGSPANYTGASYTGMVTTTYTFNITVDGVARSPSITSNFCGTYTNMMNQMNTNPWFLMSLNGGNLRVTSKTLGSPSAISISAGAQSSLTGYVGLGTAVAGVGTSYRADIYVPAGKVVIIDGSTAQTYSDLIARLNTAFGSDAVASLSGGNLLITSNTMGTSSSVGISDTNLFNSLTGYVALGTPVAGTDFYVYPTTFAASYKFSNNANTTQLQILKCTIDGATTKCTYI